MILRRKCPRCHIDPERRGLSVRCPECGFTITIRHTADNPDDMWNRVIKSNYAHLYTRNRRRALTRYDIEFKSDAEKYDRIRAKQGSERYANNLY